MLHLKDFDYNLPKELIAQRPVKPRDHSRLLALHKDSGEIEHKHFYDIVDYLKKGDVLVLNNSKVFPARLIGKKAGTAGKIEVFLLKRIRGALWQCLLGGHADDITKHKMHAEYVEVKKSVIKRIIRAKQEGRRVIAVGTTSVRTLETIASKFLISNFQFSNNFQFSISKNKVRNFSGWTDIFIYQGYKFKIVDAMITNFHLPKSTLLMLVSAFAGKKNINKAYKIAIKNKYRFYSYGDAMLIFND